MCKISIIMGIYKMINKKAIVKLAIDSILNQTYRDFEFIICDDGSNDGTYEMVQGLIRNDKRVILIKNNENKGLAYSLNHCLSIAKGKYIARMDADDISTPNRLEKQIKFLDEHLEYAIVGCNLLLINDKGIWGKRILAEKPTKKSFLFTSPFCHPAIVMRKDVLDKVNNYKVEKITRRAEDYDLFMRIYVNGYKGYNLQEFLYQFREDNDAYKRRAYKYRIDDVQVRYRGFKALGLMPSGFLYVIKPLIVGLIPQKILCQLRKLRIEK
ncbi:Spore coat polysaccharide biosynthesis protein spsA [Megamonas hypermegale]|uniref:Spore coat polysaccharide biosynthesis protein spsA n=2 Tax=Megamonas hypermegale TaxID=158847 RepID=A0A239U7K7_9FIRM|nr:Spore coat polysaccharide biosynthesis protein spsA [Megamonas hypermegale]